MWACIYRTKRVKRVLGVRLELSMHYVVIIGVPMGLGTAANPDEGDVLPREILWRVQLRIAILQRRVFPNPRTVTNNYWSVRHGTYQDIGQLTRSGP